MQFKVKKFVCCTTVTPTKYKRLDWEVRIGEKQHEELLRVPLAVRTTDSDKTSGWICRSHIGVTTATGWRIFRTHQIIRAGWAAVRITTGDSWIAVSARWGTVAAATVVTARWSVVRIARTLAYTRCGVTRRAVASQTGCVGRVWHSRAVAVQGWGSTVAATAAVAWGGGAVSAQRWRRAKAYSWRAVGSRSWGRWMAERDWRTVTPQAGTTVATADAGWAVAETVPVVTKRGWSATCCETKRDRTKFCWCWSHCYRCSQGSVSATKTKATKTSKPMRGESVATLQEEWLT